MGKRYGPAAGGAAAGAGDRASGDAQLDTIPAMARQAATTTRPGIAVVTCRIVRFAPHSFWAAVGPGARCIACSSQLAQLPPVVAVVEAPSAGIFLVAGICTRCAAVPDRDLIVAAYAALRAVAPSLQPLGPGGTA
jgi:hypothetical protein